MSKASWTIYGRAVPEQEYLLHQAVLCLLAPAQAVVFAQRARRVAIRNGDQRYALLAARILARRYLDLGSLAKARRYAAEVLAGGNVLDGAMLLAHCSLQDGAGIASSFETLSGALSDPRGDAENRGHARRLLGELQRRASGIAAPVYRLPIPANQTASGRRKAARLTEAALCLARSETLRAPLPGVGGWAPAEVAMPPHAARWDLHPECQGGSDPLKALLRMLAGARGPCPPATDASGGRVLEATMDAEDGSGVVELRVSRRSLEIAGALGLALHLRGPVKRKPRAMIPRPR